MMFDNIDSEKHATEPDNNVDVDVENDINVDVLSLANSIVQSLYNDEDDDDNMNEENIDDEMDEEEQHEERHNKDVDYNDSNENEKDSINNNVAMDYDLDQDALIKDLVGSAVESLENQMAIGESETHSFSQQIQDHQDEQDDDTKRENQDELGEHQENTLKTVSTVGMNSIDSNVIPHQTDKNIIHDQIAEHEQATDNVENNELDDAIADAFRDQYNFSDDQLPVESSENHERENGGDDMRNLVNAITEAFENTNENETKSIEENIPTVKDIGFDDTSNYALQEKLKQNERIHSLNSVELELNSALEYVFQDDTKKNDTKKITHSNKQDNEEYLKEATIDLNAAIAEALKNTESVLEGKNYRNTTSNDEQNHEFDNFYHDMQSLVTNAISETHPDQIQKESDNKVDEKVEDDEIANKDKLDNTTLEEVIHDIDLNDVLANAMKETRERDNSYETNSELNDAIKEALLSVPNSVMKKKSTKKDSTKKKPTKTALSEKKKSITAKPNAKPKPKPKPKSESKPKSKSKSKSKSKLKSKVDDITGESNDVSKELTDAITDALKDTGLTDTLKDAALTGTTKDLVLPVSNEIGFEDALKNVVNDVIEHTLAESQNNEISNVNEYNSGKNNENIDEDLGDEVDNHEKEDIEKESDYNWDDIMGNAFEMAMEYPNDLKFDVESSAILNDELNVQHESLNEASETTVTKKHLKIPNQPITFIQAPNINKIQEKSLTSESIPPARKQNIQPMPSAVPNKSTEGEAVGNLLATLNLKSLEPNEVITGIKPSQLDSIKKYVASAITALMSSNNQQGKESKRKEDMDEKERVRFENRERKKRWREFNIERNRDIDLKTRVIKRANHLYPNPEHEELRKQWISTEFDKRKQKRMNRQQKKSSNYFDIKSFESKDTLPYDIFFKDKDNLSKIAQIYNEMGGNVSSDRLFSSMADKTVTISSISSVLVVAFLLKNKASVDEKDIQTMVQTLVLSLDRYICAASNETGSSFQLKNTPLSSTSDSEILRTQNSIQDILSLSTAKEKVVDKTVWNEPIAEKSEKPTKKSFDNKLMKLAPIIGGGISFKVQSQTKENKEIAQPSYTADADLTKLVKEKKSLNAVNEAKLSDKSLHSAKAKINTRVGKGNKKRSDYKQKKKMAVPVAVNIEKFLLPQPPPASLLQKKKEDIISLKRKHADIVDKNTLKVDDIANKRRLNDGGSVIPVLDNVSSSSKKNDSKIDNNTQENKGSQEEVKNMSIKERVEKILANAAEKSKATEKKQVPKENTSNTPKSRMKRNNTTPKPVAPPPPPPPSIPLPHYRMPNGTKSMNKTGSKLPVSLKKPSGIVSVGKNIVIGNGLKRPGAFRKPGAFKKPDELQQQGIVKPFGGITPVKKL